MSPSAARRPPGSSPSWHHDITDARAGARAGDLLSGEQPLEAMHERVDAELELAIRIPGLERALDLLDVGRCRVVEEHDLDAGRPHRMTDDELRDQLHDR